MRVSPTNRSHCFGSGLKVYGCHHPPPRAHNGSHGQTRRESTLAIPSCAHRFFFVYCIANFDCGLRDIPLLSTNPAGASPGRMVTVRNCPQATIEGNLIIRIFRGYVSIDFKTYSNFPILHIDALWRFSCTIILIAPLSSESPFGLSRCQC